MTNDPNWAGGLPSLSGMTEQSAGQGGGSWNLGQLIPNALQGTGQPQGNPQSVLPNNSLPNYRPPGFSSEPNSVFPPAGNFAPPAGNGFSGYDGYRSGSVQEPGYVMPR